MNDLIIKKKYYILFTLLIVFLAIFFRTWHIKQTPPGFWGDEAVNANEGLRLVEDREIQIFFQQYDQRESLFFYFIGISTKLFGENQPWAARLPSVLFGLLSVLGVFLLASELFDRDIGIFASYFMAVSFWHTLFSRIAFRAIMVPAICCFALYFLVAAIKKDKTLYYLLGGIIFGLGFYTYFSYDIMPLIFLTFIPFFILAKRKSKSNGISIFKGIILFLAVAFLVALPMGIFLIKNPSSFTTRMSSLSVFNMETPWKRWLWNIGLTLLMFTQSGDKNPRHNIPARPQLAFPVGILFWIGLIIICMYIYQGIRKKDWWNIASSVLILSLWGGMLLPSTFSYVGIPHATRTLGAIVPTYIMVAMGFKFILLILKNVLKKYRFGENLIKISVVAILLWATFINFQDYFFKYPQLPEIEEAFSMEFVNTGEFLNQFPDTIPKYVFLDSKKSISSLDESPLPAQVVLFITSNNKEIKFISLTDIPTSIEDIYGNYVIVLPNYDPELGMMIMEKINLDLKETVTENDVYVLSHGDLN